MDERELDDETVRESVADHWDDALAEWRDELEPADVELVEEIGLLDEYEFFWDDAFDRVGYEAPSVPKDWKTRDYADDIESWAQVSRINVAMSDLGQALRERVEDDLGID
ncbi:MAG: hypothetical protein U5J64_12035 [Halobacteriales archaeon]|nr:hypothetical protein [Halobacteriales archaeon]